MRVTAFTVSELLRENQQWGGGGKITPPPRLGLSLKRSYEIVIENYSCVSHKNKQKHNQDYFELLLFHDKFTI